MNEILRPNKQSNQHYITRSVFQAVLHQALTTEKGSLCCGLLGVSVHHGQTIQHVLMMKQAELLPEHLPAWAEQDIACVGLFHLEHQDVPELLCSVMPDPFIELSANLDEEGRLDLLAYEHFANPEGSAELNLNLIEDGQLVADE